MSESTYEGKRLSVFHGMPMYDSMDGVQIMKSVAVLIVFVLLTGGAFWFVWMNRASEKIVTSTLPIAVAAIVGVVLAGLVFGGDADYEAVFPVCYMLDLDSKLPLDSMDEMNKLPTENSTVFGSHRFSFGQSPVPELKKQRPDLFADKTKNDFSVNIYHHLLQRSLIDFLAMRYWGSWKAEALLFNLGSIGFGRYGGNINPDTSLGRTVLTAADLEKILKGNWFARIHRWPSLQLSLPPDSKIAIRVPAGGPDATGRGEVRISNRFCTITLATEVALPIRTIGEYRIMTGLSDEQVRDLATNVYLLRAHVHYTRWLFGHPEMKAHKEWATQLVNDIRNQFDEQVIWTLVKEDDLRSHLHPPEPLRSRLQHPDVSRKKESKP
jgi:hypothetical protein